MKILIPLNLFIILSNFLWMAFFHELGHFLRARKIYGEKAVYIKYFSIRGVPSIHTVVESEVNKNNSYTIIYWGVFLGVVPILYSSLFISELYALFLIPYFFWIGDDIKTLRGKK